MSVPMPRPILGSHTATPENESSRRLALAFDRAIENVSEKTMRILNAAALDFVDRRRVSGMPPEEVIVALKNVLRSRFLLEQGWVPSLADSGSSISNHGATAVYERVFGWCVDAYFDETERSRGRRGVFRHRRVTPATAWSARH
jgi:hypothetical protein